MTDTTNIYAAVTVLGLRTPHHDFAKQTPLNKAIITREQQDWFRKYHDLSFDLPDCILRDPLTDPPSPPAMASRSGSDTDSPSPAK